MLRRLCFVVSLIASLAARPAVADDPLLQVLTVSAESDEPILGACFEVYDAAEYGTRGATPETYCDDADGEDGIVTIELPAGQYILVEIQAPDGFALTVDRTVELEAGLESKQVRIRHQSATLSTPTPAPTATTTPQNAGSGPIQGQFEIESGRRLYLSCQGTGDQTVVLEAGGPGRNSSEWQTIQQGIATVARTCVYDRASLGNSDRAPPGTRTVDDSVNDLHSLLSAAGVSCPCVFVGSSWGGVIVRRYAGLFPEDIAGLVFVDGIPPGFLARFLELVPDVDSPALLEERNRLLGDDNPEQIDQLTSLKLADDSDPPPAVPAAVMTHSFILGLGFSLVFPERELEQAWRQAQEDYAASINAHFIPADKSGSDILLEQPDFVTDAIRYVVEVVQDPASGVATVQVRQGDREETPLADACFQLFSAPVGAGDLPKDIMCDVDDGSSDGSTTFENVPPGHYVLQNTKVPPGYLPAADRPFNVPPRELKEVLIVFDVDPAAPAATPSATPIAAGS